MESSNACSWLMNFEMNYCSFFQDFEQFDELVPSPPMPDISSISPGCCLSNSSSNIDQSPEIYGQQPPSERNLPNVDTDQAKKKKRPRNNSGNCRSAKERNGIDREASKNSSENTGNSNLQGGRGRKRTYEETVKSNRKNSNNSSVNPAFQPEMHNRKDHVMAERKRREKLTQRFIALSSLVPGLTRMDKASVLADAIKYVKQLQEKVQILETEATQKNVQAAVIIKKLSSPDECNSFTCDNNSPDNELSAKAGSLLEIEVQISEQRVLIKIHCESQKGVLVKALSEIESLGLTIVTTSVVPFTSSSIDITITAKADEELSLTVEDLVRRLNFALNSFNSSA